MFCFFFFSSRRRHTRWTGDWSSDVCSSDLETVRDKKNPAVRQALTQRVTRMRRIESLRMRTEFTLKTFEGARTPSKSVQPKSQPSKACFHASRFTSAMDSVSGMFLGQAFTQFCALAHSCTPPGPI